MARQCGADVADDAISGLTLPLSPAPLHNALIFHRKIAHLR
jgi:hypothetical protein